MNPTRLKYLLPPVALSLGLFATSLHADVDLPTKFSNAGGISNTRHNMTQSTIGAGGAVMNPYRNDYGEVCVYWRYS